MMYFKKLWSKTKFYSDLLAKSMLLNLVATAAVLALLVFAPPFIALTFGIAAGTALTISAIASVVVVSLALYLNFWVWSNPMNMSNKLWDTKFSDAQTIRVILESFVYNPKYKQYTPIEAINTLKIPFLNQQDISGHTAITALALKSRHMNAYNAAKVNLAIKQILLCLPSETRYALIMQDDAHGHSLWSIVTEPNYKNPVLLNTILECFNSEQVEQLLNRQITGPNPHYLTGSLVPQRAVHPNLLSYSIKYDHFSEWRDTLSQMLYRLSVKQRRHFISNNLNGASFIENAAAVGNERFFRMLVDCFCIHNEALRQQFFRPVVIKSNLQGMNLFEVAVNGGHCGVVRCILEKKVLTEEEIYASLEKEVHDSGSPCALLKNLCMKEDGTKGRYGYENGDIVNTIGWVLQALTQEKKKILLLVPRASGLTLIEECILAGKVHSATMLMETFLKGDLPTVEQLRAKLIVDDPGEQQSNAVVERVLQALTEYNGPLYHNDDSSDNAAPLLSRRSVTKPSEGLPSQLAEHSGDDDNQTDYTSAYTESDDGERQNTSSRRRRASI